MTFGGRAKAERKKKIDGREESKRTGSVGRDRGKRTMTDKCFPAMEGEEEERKGR